MILKVNKKSFEAQRVFCIGKNYVAHIRELKGQIPNSPVFFQKPNTSLVPMGHKIQYPSHGSNLHHEVEVVVLIGKAGKLKSKSEAKSYISGLSLGLDLTLRDVQTYLKKMGLPWEASKAFDFSAPLGEFIPYTSEIDLKNITFSCWVNEELRQEGNTIQMIFDIETLIWETNKIWKYKAGDLIYTGTPEGVGPLRPGDRIQIAAEKIGKFGWEVV